MYLQFTYCMLSIGCTKAKYFSIILTHMCVHIGSLCMDDIWYTKAIKTHIEHVDSPGAVRLVFQSCRTNEMRHCMRAPSTTTLPFVLFLRRTFFLSYFVPEKSMSFAVRTHRLWRRWRWWWYMCAMCTDSYFFLTRFIEHIEFHTFRTMDAT